MPTALRGHVHPCPRKAVGMAPANPDPPGLRRNTMHSAPENRPPVPLTQPDPPVQPPRSSQKHGRRLVYAVAAVPLLTLPLFGWALAGRLSREKPVTHQVRREKLQHAITARGDLEAVDTSEIVCRVQSRVHGRTNSTSIKWIVEDGSRVARGQLLVEFDD